MKKTMSLAAIAALFAIGTAFAPKFQEGQWWNVDHPAKGTPGIFFLSALQVKTLYCPGVNNLECAYLVGAMGTIVKKP
jgi:hypothetical protein